ncbi:MAG: vWA domain-containing protein [Myxococcales bacterium]|jgi:Ca-activated chloride channel family protein
MRTPTMTYLMIGAGITLLVAAAAASLGPSSPRETPERVPPGNLVVTPVAPAVSSNSLPATAPLPEATGSDTVELSAALGYAAVLEGSADPNYVRWHIQARPVESEGRSPVSIAVALDRSGSMSGEKLDQAKAAIARLIDNLDPSDHFALVIYDDSAEVFYPSSPVTAENRKEMRFAVASVAARGATNISAGLERAAAEARRGTAGSEAVARVLLVSDGLTNRGLTDPSQLAYLAQRFRKGGVTVSTIGVGADFDHRLMSDLAENGAGQYHYLDEPEKLAGVFAEELRQAVATVARDVSLLVKLAPGVRLSEVYGFAHRVDATGLVSVPIPDLHSQAGWQVIMKLEGGSARGATMPLADGRLVYTDLLRDRAGQVAAAEPLVATVTSSAEQVRKQENATVMVEVVRMEGALAAQRASEMLERGRNQDAARILAQAQQATDQANQRYKSSVLTRFSGNLRALFSSSANTLAGSAGSAHLAKRQHRMLRSFGSTSNSIASP